MPGRLALRTRFDSHARAGIGWDALRARSDLRRGSALYAGMAMHAGSPSVSRAAATTSAPSACATARIGAVAARPHYFLDLARTGRRFAGFAFFFAAFFGAVFFGRFSIFA